MLLNKSKHSSTLLKQVELYETHKNPAKKQKKKEKKETSWKCKV